MRVLTIGWKAHAALSQSGGTAQVLAPLSASVYLTVGDELVWLGTHGSAQHPRAILCAEAPALDAAREDVWLDVAGLEPWTAPALDLTPTTARALVAGCRRLVADVGAIGAPDGFGAMLAGAVPAFPLDAALGRARTLAAACAHDNADGAADAATALLGLGPGLTPSGDDFVGAAFFARTLVARAGLADAAAWRRAAETIRRAAPALTHPISVALLGDLLDGHGWAPLHTLAETLASDAPPTTAVDAARRLVRIGHSSGWDLLAGFVTGAGALGD